MKNLLTASLLALLVACGGGGSPSSPVQPVDPVEPVEPPPPPPPEAGTILDSDCQEYTLVEQIADGEGGRYEEVTPRSEACGWNPPPYGEPYGTDCEEPYTLVETFHDGEYGLYDERTEDSETCGYIPPSLTVTIDNTYGDRFRPVVVTVDYTVQGEAAEWTYEVEAGRAVKVDDNTLHIFGGEGNSVDFILYINEESFLYQLKEEPRCAVEDNLDCLGYIQYGEWDLIYYGEGDTLVVPIELAVTQYTPDMTIDGTAVAEDSWEYRDTASRVDEYNRIMERDGIYIEWKLVGVYWSYRTGLYPSEQFIQSLRADIGLGKGYTLEDTCGVARPNTKFDKAGFGFSVCGVNVDLHELGHVVGLAHGPNNPTFAQEGYIFPEFGHGDYDQCGGTTDDIMSYGAMDHFFNSELDCADVYPGRTYVGLAGDRFRADTAYHWNRIRYDLSLINDEHNKKDPAEARPRGLNMDDDRPIIVD